MLSTVEQLEQRIVRYRRKLHRHAETKWTEFWTSSFIADRLEEAGFQIKTGLDVVDPAFCAGRPEENEIDGFLERALNQGANPDQLDRMKRYPGVVAVLDTGRPGPSVAFRADIDAVSNQESTEPGHRPYDEGFSSVNSNSVHACGHDGHAAIVLGAAEQLMAERDELCGVFTFIFQPSEEGGGGGKAMTSKGIGSGVDYLFTFHLSLAPSHVIAGGCNDFVDNRRYDATFTGRAAHPVGDPHNGKNALLAACSAAMNLHCIAPHGDGCVWINVGVLSAGTGRNVVAPGAFFQVESRAALEHVADYAEERVLKIIEHAAGMYDVSVGIERIGHALTGSSDPEMAELVLEEAKKIAYFHTFLHEGRVGGSDDATDFMRFVQEQGGKATYISLGCDSEKSLHNGSYDIDEGVLLPGAELFVKLAKHLARRVTDCDETS